MLNAAVATFLAYGVLNIVFECAVLGMVSPRWRLAVLGSKSGRAFCHVSVMIINLILHWGTLGGTSGAQASFLLSFIGIPLCMALWGWTYLAPTEVNGVVQLKRRHRRGIFGYTKEELRLPAWYGV